MRIGLTAKQQFFTDAVLKGASKADAARAAGVVGDAEYCYDRAKAFLRSQKVRLAIERGQAVQAKRSTWARDDMLRVLREIADDEARPAAARIAAITAGARMLGFDSPLRVSVEVGPNTLLEQIREAQARREEAATVGA